MPKKNKKNKKTPKMLAFAEPSGAVVPTTIELYTTVLRRLNEAILRMTSSDFDALLQEGTVEQRQRAARALIQVQHARLALGNAVLSEIAAQLKANEQAFIEGQVELGEQLQRLENIEAVLTTIGKFVKLVGTIVQLV